MRIENLRSEKMGDRQRVSATVIWEDYNRASQELYFETEERFAQDLSCSPHAFLIGSALAAMRFGERRILMDAEICPELRDGLMTAMAWIRHWWYKTDQKMVKIEAKTRATEKPKPPRAGVFFSGGIDALATLRANRVYYPLEHPGSIKDGLLVFGLEVIDPKKFEYVLNSLSILAQDADITLIPVYTNIRSLGPESGVEFWGDFWLNEFMGAAFASIAHVFSNRLSVVSINSCHDIPNIIPYSSHPLINPNYTSSDLRIRHEGITFSRFEKTKLVAGWDLALQHLRVCNRSELYQPDMLNCGNCEKCIRTMLSLLALGVLEKTRAFPIHDINASLIDTVVQIQQNTYPLYGELIAPLTEVGRHDLVLAIERKIAEYQEPQWKKELKRKKNSWKKKTLEEVAEFDSKNLYGSLMKIKRVFIKRSLMHT